MQVLSKAVFPLALLCLACLAQAGEVILFEHSDFRGRTLTLRGTAPNLDIINFNDRASSVRVLSGLWEMCTDAYFRGRCATFGPGDYVSLGGQSNSYSSVRELASGGRSRPPSPPSDGAIVLFDDEGFRGRGFGINSAMPNFDPTGFNDRARSLIVKSGIWEVCTDADYRGRCRIFPKGEHPALDLGLNEQISSARPAAYDGNNWSAAGSTWFGAGNGSVILYAHDNFEGRSRTLDGPVGNFDQIGFNDMVSSLIVRRGLWELCTDAKFRGTCRVYRPGEYRSFGPRLNDQFSSARLVGQ
jgi:Beta/Gamma crystallin